MHTKFYVCRHCGNVIEKVHDAGVPVVCCGEKMEELIPNTVEASGEKHLPVISVEGDVISVNVGSIDHPMVNEHYIQWISVVTENGSQRRFLKPGDSPRATFCLGQDKAVAVYAYCNLHGLWKTEA
ncbi:MAG: desulfoferrodoxin [Clostridiales bacterium]|nr:desulfoferrodoxin [Clostridiales bacterium]MDY2656871.1 desulfoferrodoxin family protein [Candidatus Limiplasma sp.]